MTFPLIFDRTLKARQRARAVKLLPGRELLVKEIASRLAEKFEDEFTQTFPEVLELGARGNILRDALGGKAGIQNYTLYEGDEEVLAVTPESYDLIISNLALHWVNDLPGCFRRIHAALKPGGLFLATMFGTETLRELRAAMMATELGLTGGTSPRVSPFTLVKDAGMLLQRCGFAEPVSVGDSITVLHGNAFALMHDLRAMGETSALLERNKVPPTREFFALTNQCYIEEFGTEEGYIPATFDIITLTGWK